MLDMKLTFGGRRSGLFGLIGGRTYFGKIGSENAPQRFPRKDDRRRCIYPKGHKDTILRDEAHRAIIYRNTSKKCNEKADEE